MAVSASNPSGTGPNDPTGPSEMAVAVSPRFGGDAADVVADPTDTRGHLKRLSDRVSETIEDTKWELDVRVGAAEQVHAEWYEDVKDPIGRETVLHASISDAFNMLAVAATTLFVALFVVGMISDTMDFGEEHAFGDEAEEIEGITADAFMLGAVALIVLVASVILWLVSGFGDNGGRM